MTALPVLPDCEALIGGWLREHPDIVAMDALVAGRTPTSTIRPWVRVTQLDATDSRRSRVEYLVDYLLQLDCFAGEISTEAHVAQAEASRLARTVRAVLKDREGQAGDGVVVTRVQFTGHARLPDGTLEPARERVVLTAEVMMHAIPGP